MKKILALILSALLLCSCVKQPGSADISVFDESTTPNDITGLSSIVTSDDLSELSTTPKESEGYLTVGYINDIDPALYEGRKPIKFGTGSETVLIFSNEKYIKHFNVCSVSYIDGEFYFNKDVFSIFQKLSDYYYIEYSTYVPQFIPAEAIIFEGVPDETGFGENFSFVINWNTIDGTLSAVLADINYDKANYHPDYKNIEEMNAYLAEFSLAGDAELIVVDGDNEWNKNIAVKYPNNNEPVVLCDSFYYRYFDISPDMKKISYTLLDHNGGPLYIYDILSRELTNITEFDRPKERDVSKRATWLSDEILLVTVGLDQGSTTKGGDIHYYNIINGENTEIIKANPDKPTGGGQSWIEFIGMELVGDCLEFGVCVLFDSAMYNFNYTDRISITQVYDLINANETFEYDGVVIDNQS